MASETRQDPERIYLEPAPGSPEGRLWCEDNVWPLDGDSPGGVEYIRADLHDAEITRLTAELEDARERERECREVLVNVRDALIVLDESRQQWVRWLVDSMNAVTECRTLRSEAQGEGWQVTEPARDIVRREMSETRATVREAIRAARRGESDDD